MEIVGGDKWCRTGNYPCPVLAYLKWKTQCFSFEEIVAETMEDEAKLMNCLKNQLVWDVVCRDEDKNLWCPDNVY